MLFAAAMVTPALRKLLLLLAIPYAGAGCATDDATVDDYEDVDGSGKADGATSTDPTRLVDVPFDFGTAK